MTRIQRHTLRAALLAALIVPILLADVSAQSAAVAQIESPVIASGGGDMLGTGNEEINATIGQPLTPADTLQGAQEETVWIGFWSVLPSDPSSIREERIARSVLSTRINAIAPNPFTDRVVFDVDLAATSYVVLAVHDQLGREVARLIDGERTIGAHRVTWKPENLPAGSYLVRLEIDGASHSASAIQNYR